MRRSPNRFGHFADGAAALEKARERSAIVAGARELISPGDAAAIARVSHVAILRAHRAGELPGQRLIDGGSSVVFEPEDVRRWARSKRYIA